MRASSRRPGREPARRSLARRAPGRPCRETPPPVRVLVERARKVRLFPHRQRVFDREKHELAGGAADVGDGRIDCTRPARRGAADRLPRRRCRGKRSRARSGPLARCARSSGLVPQQSEAARQSRSALLHQPATVGKSCVLVIATASRVQLEGRVNQPSSRSNQSTRRPSTPGLRQPSLRNPRARCRDPRPERSRDAAGFERDQPQQILLGHGEVRALIRACAFRHDPEPANPIAWSMRTPPACRRAARIISRKADSRSCAARAARNRPGPSSVRAGRAGQGARRPKARSASRPDGSRRDCRRNRCRPRDRRSVRSACPTLAPPAAPPEVRCRQGTGARHGRRLLAGGPAANRATPGLCGSRNSSGQSRQCQRRGPRRRNERAAPRIGRAARDRHPARGGIRQARRRPVALLRKRGGRRASGRASRRASRSAAGFEPRPLRRIGLVGQLRVHDVEQRAAGRRVRAEPVGVGRELRMDRADRDGVAPCAAAERTKSRRAAKSPMPPSPARRSE